MIDNVKLVKYHRFDEALFLCNNFEFRTSKKSNLKYCYKKVNRVTIIYFLEQDRIMIIGRIINLYKYDIGRVKNFDDVMLEEDVCLEYIFRVIEHNLVKLFFPISSDDFSICLSEFDVNRIEYCINLYVGNQVNVDAYLKMMNLIFFVKKDKRYKNHVAEKNLELHTSSYIKANKLYEKNSKIGTIINFYNKYNQLSNEKTQNWKIDDIANHNNSINEADGVLRLEVISGSQTLYQIRKKEGISIRFEDYKDLDLAYNLIMQKYKSFYIGGGFYSNKEIKKVIKASELSEKTQENLIEKYSDYSKKLGQMYKGRKYVKNTFSDYYKRKVKSIGVNPITIPAKFNVNRLECPLKLIQNKREKLPK